MRAQQARATARIWALARRIGALWGLLAVALSVLTGCAAPETTPIGRPDDQPRVPVNRVLDQHNAAGARQ